jgi:DNA-binding CsgD family transcriptional regulator
MGPIKRDLSDRDLKDVLLVSRLALECSQVNELREEMLRLLEQVFKTEDSNFFLCGGPDQKINLDHVISRGIEKEAINHYRQYYYKLDPFYKKIDSLHTAVTTREHVIPFQEWVQGEYYNDFLKPQSIHYEMTIFLRMGNLKLGVVALFRSRNATNFSLQEKAKAELIAPYIAKGLEKASVLEQIKRNETFMKSIVEDMPNKGIIILDENLGLSYYNKEAIKLLSAISQNEMNGKSSLEKLPKGLYLQCQEFKKSMFTRGLTDSVQEHKQFISTSETKMLIRIRLIPSGTNSHFFLIYLEPEESISSQLPLMKKFGFTRRELEVIKLISLGLKNSETSDKLFISEHTVENHLKSIYQKIGVKSRTALIHRVTHPHWPNPEAANGTVDF